MKKQYALICGTALVSCLFGQWEPDTRLSFDDSISTTFLGHAWCIAGVESLVAAVWQDNREGSWEVYSVHSTSSGVQWSSAARLSDTLSDSEYPCLAMSSSTIHVAWQDKLDGNKEIYYSRSTDWGFSWDVPARITYDSTASMMPSIAVHDSEVYIVWNNEQAGFNDVYFIRSLDNGSTWGDLVRITSAPMPSLYPKIAVGDSIVHVVWARAWEIYHMRSIDRGDSWDPENRLTYDANLSLFASVAAVENVVHAVWHDQRLGNTDIFYTRSLDAGVTWEADRPLTTDPSSSNIPSLAATSSHMHAVWYDNRIGNYEIYYRHSSDFGTTWEDEVRLTDQDSTSKAPCMCAAGPSLHVLWSDNRDGNWEVYYKRDPTGSHCDERAAGNMGRTLMYISPNPCREDVCLVVEPWNRTTMQESLHIRIFSSTGQVVRELMPRVVSVVPVAIVWDGKDEKARKVPAGVYFVECTVAQRTEMGKVVIVR